MYIITGQQQNRAKSLLGQASIEMAVIFILLFLLFVGTVKIFIWLNLSMVERQKHYEDIRGAAYTDDTPPPMDYKPEALDIFH